MAFIIAPNRPTYTSGYVGGCASAPLARNYSNLAVGGYASSLAAPRVNSFSVATPLASPSLALALGGYASSPVNPRVIAGGGAATFPMAVRAGQAAQYLGAPSATPRIIAAQPVAQYAGAAQYVGAVGAAASPQLISIVKNYLDNREDLKDAVIYAFRNVAGNSDRLDMNGLIRFRAELSREIGVPDQIFGDITDEYMRFDFDGSGFLETNEVYKLVKAHLHEFLHVNAGHGSSQIPFKTLQQAGYTTTKDLGAGSQGSVKLAVDQYGNQRCVKQYKKSEMANFGGLAATLDEFETMQLLGCKNIAKTFEIFQDHMNVYMVNEVFLGKDLCKVEQHAMSKGVHVTENWWRGIFRQCFEALAFMHQQAMMHCDIKEPNLMLRTENYANPEVVLIDFGVSKAMAARDDGMCSGTPGYMPPETMNTGKWHARGDVFSMGVVMMQLLTHKVPDEDKAKMGILIGIFLDGCNSMDDIKMAVTSRTPPFHLMPPQWSGITQICRTCLDKDFRNRKKAPVILKDPWFASAIGQAGLPIEKAMQPANQMATIGITPDMIKSLG